MTKLSEDQIMARERLLADCPIIVAYAETGTGKTTFVSDLMLDERYQRTLFIDGDRGGATVAHLTGRPELCDYRRPEKEVTAHQIQQYMIRQIAQAHKAEGVQSIIIEGMARMYEDAVGEQFAGASDEDLQGHRLRRLYIVPSGHVKALIAAIGGLQQRLRAAKRAVPIFLTCNTKELTDDSSGKTFQVPAISANTTKILMGRADAFVQLRRIGNTVTMLTDRDLHSDARKVRHHGAAKALAKLKNPNAVTMIQVWADAVARDAASINSQLEENENN